MSINPSFIALRYQLVVQVDVGTTPQAGLLPSTSSSSIKLENLASNQILVDVRVEDVNDNELRFVDASTGNRVDGLICGVAPTTSVGDVVLKAVAVDDDEGLNAVVKYEIVQGDADADKFVVDETNGIVRWVGG